MNMSQYDTLFWTGVNACLDLPTSVEPEALTGESDRGEVETRCTNRHGDILNAVNTLDVDIN